MREMGNEGNKTQTFEDLKVWQQCRELRSKVSSLVRRFPRSEQYRLGLLIPLRRWKLYGSDRNLFI